VLLHPVILFRFFLSVSFVSEFLLKISSLLSLILLGDLSRDNLLLVKVGVVRDMLDLKFIRIFTESELYSDVSTFEALSMALIDDGMGLFPSGELNESKTPVLIVLRVERHVNGVDSDILDLAKVCLKLLVPHIKGQVTHDEPSLMLSSVFFWSVGILFHVYLF
jgi:hypothetical protein